MQQKRWSKKLLIVLGALLLLLAGCGNAQNGLTGSPNATATTSTTATVLLRGMPTPRPVTPVPTTPGSVTVPPDQVLITVAKSSYASNEAITATISNGLASTILVADHQSICTILTLQMQAGNQWIKQAPCRLSTATHLFLIPAHTSRTQSLVPGSPSWTGGQYRLMLSYTVGTTDVSSARAFTNVYSPVFVIV